MQRLFGWRLYAGLLFATGCLAQAPGSPQALTWQETQARFRANNPTLLAGEATINEAKAQEVTAYLRPNPDLTLGLDQITPFSGSPFRPLWQTYAYGDISYLHEREHKRELRLEDAKENTQITTETQNDLERNLMFNLRDAFVRVLQAKAVVQVARDNLTYYDKEIDIAKTRYQAGDIAQVDFERIEVQRVQYLSDLQNAVVSLRTAKIDLIALLDDHTPVDQFDIVENFDFQENLKPIADLRQVAIDQRPDLKEAVTGLERARTDHRLTIANGSTDPTFGMDGSHQAPPLNTYIGFSVTIPLRIFDRNQGEKVRTQLDIARNEKLVTAAQVAVYHDVDSAYMTVQSTLELLKPYKQKYLQEALDVRDKVAFSYLHGAASLLEFLDAEKAYRDTELNYLMLVGAYLSAANQVNYAVGREVM
ncbi:MAG TPA: TolC family protein [Bryobacteraceae bacterium]|jgi:cobalt-zinc-cadmium efflux system outer membrane protein|nr:TolC family protein [Bryobacteraceae bacterium]